MAKIVCLGSSSSGNCFVITFHNEKLGYSQAIMLESGLSFKETIKRAVLNGNDLTKVKTCLITHGHGDHCCSALEFETKNNMRIYASEDTLKQFKSVKNIGNVLKANEQKVIANGIIILPFEVEHDFPNSFGFVIYCSVTKETICFINDSKFVDFNKCDISQYDFDYVMIECNYEDKQVRAIYEPSRKALENGTATEEDRNNVFEYSRVINSHMSLYGTLKTLERMKLSKKCKAIFLMHLSNRHANPHVIKSTVSNRFNIPTYVCRKLGGVM